MKNITINLIGVFFIWDKWIQFINFSKFKFLMVKIILRHQIYPMSVVKQGRLWNSEIFKTIHSIAKYNFNLIFKVVQCTVNIFSQTAVR